MKKLELKHLAPYLPYGLKCSNNKKTYKQKGDYRYGVLEQLSPHEDDCVVMGKNGYFLVSVIDIIPILRPLSDLTKEIEVNGEKFIPIVKIRKDIEYKYDVNINYDGNLIFKPKKDNKFLFGFEVMKVQNMLFEWHFDIHGLIKENLAIDINTL